MQDIKNTTDSEIQRDLKYLLRKNAGQDKWVTWTKKNTWSEWQQDWFDHIKGTHHKKDPPLLLSAERNSKNHIDANKSFTGISKYWNTYGEGWTIKCSPNPMFGMPWSCCFKSSYTYIKLDADCFLLSSSKPLSIWLTFLECAANLCNDRPFGTFFMLDAKKAKISWYAATRASMLRILKRSIDSHKWSVPQYQKPYNMILSIWIILESIQANPDGKY